VKSLRVYFDLMVDEGGRASELCVRRREAARGDRANKERW
jgi:hypothetical protein